jgi:CBS domain-containing protein
LESFSLAHRPPTGFFRDFVVEHDGVHRGKLDIKHGGLLPIVDLARSAALAAGVAAASTPARLDVAEAGGTIAPTDVGVPDRVRLPLRRALGVQLAERCEARDNHIDPSALPAGPKLPRGGIPGSCTFQKGLMADIRTGMPTG